MTTPDHNANAVEPVFGEELKECNTSVSGRNNVDMYGFISPCGNHPGRQYAQVPDRTAYLEVVKQSSVHVTESDPPLIGRCEGQVSF